MKTQHTPGPWTISGTHHSIGIAPDDGKSDGLASVFGCGPQAEANAALIASAPELLYALERLANDYAALMNSQGAAIDIGQPGSEFTAGQWVGSRLGSGMQEAWKAIAKAKGEA